jgi:hypothetical protein
MAYTKAQEREYQSRMLLGDVFTANLTSFGIGAKEADEGFVYRKWEDGAGATGVEGY